MDVPDPPPLPPGFESTVASLHEVARALLAPVCKRVGEPALTPAGAGFGTPPFESGGRREQVLVEGVELVRTLDGEERRAPLASLAAAGALIEDLLGDAGAALSAAPLEIEESSSRLLGSLYALAADALRELLERSPAADAGTPPRLWPEHFDIAIELGSEQDGLRANYGLSPGDAEHPEPYFYVGPWSAAVSGPSWNARGFTGAELGYAELLGAGDPRGAAVDFFVNRRELLAGKGGG